MPTPAQRGRDLIEYYLGEETDYALDLDPEDQRSAAVDVITDVLHFCNEGSLSVADVLRIAETHFHAETKNRARPSTEFTNRERFYAPFRRPKSR